MQDAPARPPRALPARSDHAVVAVVVPQQLQPRLPTSAASPTSAPTPSPTPTARGPLLPLQPKLQLTPAHLTAAIAAVASQPPPVTPSPRPTILRRATTKKPLKANVSRAQHLVLPAPLMAAAAAALGSEDSPTSPTPSSSASSVSAVQHTGDSASNGGGRMARKQKKCSVPFCESYARSRGLCKAHGGGKRCKWPGCEVSDQGGGFCIRHGGGKRCRFDGCDKSAQSRHYCKAHGGGARCRAPGCDKSSQGGGLCRTHGGGPRRKRVVNNRGERIESPRSKKRTMYRSQMAARTLMGAAQAIEEHEAMGGDLERIECEPGSTALSFKIRRPVDSTPSATRKKRTGEREDEDQDEEEEQEEKAGTAKKRREQQKVGSGNEEHATHMFVAASLLGMQTAPTE